MDIDEKESPVFLDPSIKTGFWSAIFSPARTSVNGAPGWILQTYLASKHAVAKYALGYHSNGSVAIIYVDLEHKEYTILRPDSLYPGAPEDEALTTKYQVKGDTLCQ